MHLYAGTIEAPAPAMGMLVDPGECAWSSYRLPTGVLPQAYRLTLEAILVDGYNVTGYLEIDISTAEPTQCVVLHAMGMTIDSTTAVYPNGSQGEGWCTHIYTLSCWCHHAHHWASQIWITLLLLSHFRNLLEAT